MHSKSTQLLRKGNNYLALRPSKIPLTKRINIFVFFFWGQNSCISLLHYTEIPCIRNASMIVAGIDRKC